VVNRHTAQAHAARLGVAFDAYIEALKRVTSIEPCDQMWPPSAVDVLPTRCELLAGHVERDGTEHRRRIPGSSVVVTW
jgi:hypothetical protein